MTIEQRTAEEKCAQDEALKKSPIVLLGGGFILLCIVFIVAASAYGVISSRVGTRTALAAARDRLEPGAAQIAELPNCQDRALQDAAREVLGRSVRGVRMSTFASMPDETTPDRLVCRGRAVTYDGEEWLRFSVTSAGRGSWTIGFSAL